MCSDVVVGSEGEELGGVARPTKGCGGLLHLLESIGNFEDESTSEARCESRVKGRGVGCQGFDQLLHITVSVYSCETCNVDVVNEENISPHLGVIRSSQ